MDRIFHHYETWEEYKLGMWRSVSVQERKSFLQKAIEFTGDHVLYGSFMLKVIEQWKISCEQNLTDVSQNRKAWIGHAAATIAINCPEDITREAWGHLTKKQQDDANLKAESAIKKWEDNHEKKNKSVYKQMAFAGL